MEFVCLYRGFRERKLLSIRQPFSGITESNKNQLQVNTIKVVVAITPAEEWMRDVVMSEMANAGYETFVENEQGFEAYIPKEHFSALFLDSLLEQFLGDFQLTWESEEIEAQNWNEEWEKNYFKPLVIGDQVVVRAPFHTEYPACAHEIIIEPNMAFGTGNHETTSQVMEFMLGIDFRGKAVLDMGCGTGILAILAGHLGAERITAIDIDHWAYEAVFENSVLNKVPQIKVVRGDASLLGQEKYDVILANIQKNIILSDLPAYQKVMKPGALIVISGFYESDLADILKSAEGLGLIFLEKRVRNQWTAALLQHS